MSKNILITYTLIILHWKKNLFDVQLGESNRHVNTFFLHLLAQIIISLFN